jgi:hypothetical protein
MGGLIIQLGQSSPGGGAKQWRKSLNANIVLAGYVWNIWPPNPDGNRLMMLGKAAKAETAGTPDQLCIIISVSLCTALQPASLSDGHNKKT